MSLILERLGRGRLCPVALPADVHKESRSQHIQWLDNAPVKANMMTEFHRLGTLPSLRMAGNNAYEVCVEYNLTSGITQNFLITMDRSFMSLYHLNPLPITRSCGTQMEGI
jgi:hypothetical protein